MKPILLVILSMGAIYLIASIYHAWQSDELSTNELVASAEPSPQELEMMVKLLTRCDKGDSEALGQLSAFRRKLASLDVQTYLEQLMLLHAGRRKIMATEFPELQAIEVGECYGSRLVREKRPKEAMNALLREAQCLDSSAQILLRQLYLYKMEGYPEQDPRILELFREQAAEGSNRAKLNMADFCLAGAGMPKDLDKILAWLNENTLEEAQQMLGGILSNAKRTGEAKSILRRCMSHSWPWAHYEYAICLQEENNYTEAFRHLTIADSLRPNDWPTVISLAECYMQGLGVAENEATGLALFKRAADEGGDPSACFVVADLLLNGGGTAIQQKEALSYLQRAVEEGFEPALELLDELQESQTQSYRDISR
jgi:TPR repeat protein